MSFFNCFRTGVLLSTTSFWNNLLLFRAIIALSRNLGGCRIVLRNIHADDMFSNVRDINGPDSSLIEIYRRHSAKPHVHLSVAWFFRLWEWSFSPKWLYHWSFGSYATTTYSELTRFSTPFRYLPPSRWLSSTFPYDYRSSSTVSFWSYRDRDVARWQLCLATGTTGSWRINDLGWR